MRRVRRYNRFPIPGVDLQASFPKMRTVEVICLLELRCGQVLVRVTGVDRLQNHSVEFRDGRGRQVGMDGRAEQEMPGFEGFDP